MSDIFGSSSRQIALRNTAELEAFLRDLAAADNPDVEFQLDGLEAEQGAIRIATFLRANRYPSEVCLRWMPEEKRRRKSFIQFSEEEDQENVFDAEEETGPKQRRQKVRAQ